jgi:hypothetical protein
LLHPELQASLALAAQNQAEFQQAARWGSLGCGQRQLQQIIIAQLAQ